MSSYKNCQRIICITTCSKLQNKKSFLVHRDFARNQVVSRGRKERRSGGEPKSYFVKLTALPDSRGARGGLLASERGLRCGEPCNRHSERRETDVAQADAMTEADRRRFAAVFAADAYFQIRASRAAFLRAHLYQLAHAFLIQHLKRVVREDVVVNVEREEFARIIARYSVGRLRQVVRAE